MATLGRACAGLSTLCRKASLSPSCLGAPITIGSRSYRRYARPTFKALYKRRVEQGPEPDRHRSEWLNWNYDAELYSFGKRLGEDFSNGTLRTVFTHRSYVEKQQQKRSELELDNGVAMEIEDNAELANKGERLCRDYVCRYLRHSFPALPEEGICAISEHLLSADLLGYIASNLGLADLILCEDMKPCASTLSQTLKAVIGALAADQDQERAELFVQDFVLTQLVGKNICELWAIHNPMGIISNILEKQGREAPEPRVIFETGRHTIMAAYMVGLYSNKQLIGKGYGETTLIAEEMSARDALQQLFGTALNRRPLKLGGEGNSLNIDKSTKNPSLSEITQSLQ